MTDNNIKKDSKKLDNFISLLRDVDSITSLDSSKFEKIISFIKSSNHFLLSNLLWELNLNNVNLMKKILEANDISKIKILLKHKLINKNNLFKVLKIALQEKNSSTIVKELIQHNTNIHFVNNLLNIAYKAQAKHLSDNSQHPHVKILLQKYNNILKEKLIKEDKISFDKNLDSYLKNLKKIKESASDNKLKIQTANNLMNLFLLNNSIVPGKLFPVLNDMGDITLMKSHIISHEGILAIAFLSEDDKKIKLIFPGQKSLFEDNKRKNIHQTLDNYLFNTVKRLSLLLKKTNASELDIHGVGTGGVNAQAVIKGILQTKVHNLKQITLSTTNSPSIKINHEKIKSLLNEKKITATSQNYISSNIAIKSDIQKIFNGNLNIMANKQRNDEITQLKTKITSEQKEVFEIKNQLEKVLIEKNVLIENAEKIFNSLKEEKDIKIKSKNIHEYINLVRDNKVECNLKLNIIIQSIIEKNKLLEKKTKELNKKYLTLSKDSPKLKALLNEDYLMIDIHNMKQVNKLSNNSLIFKGPKNYLPDINNKNPLSPIYFELKEYLLKFKRNIKVKEKEQIFASFEAIARCIAYKHSLQTNQIVPILDKEGEIKDCIFHRVVNNNGLKCSILEPTDERDELIISFTGTSDKAAVKRNFANKVAGLAEIKRYSQIILNKIDNISKNKKIKVISIAGHSLGGADTQHFTLELIKNLNTNINHNINVINMFTYNSPGTLKKLEEKAISEVIKLKKQNPNIQINAYHQRVGKDLIQLFGQKHLFSDISKDLVNVRLLKFKDYYFPGNSPHNDMQFDQSIRKGDILSEESHNYIENTSLENRKNLKEEFSGYIEPNNHFINLFKNWMAHMLDNEPNHNHSALSDI